MILSPTISSVFSPYRRRGYHSDSSPPCIKLDIAQEGYSVLHVHRSADNGHKDRGRGLAVVFNESIVVHQHELNNVFKPLTFEVQLVRVNSSNSSVILANIYRPPDTSTPAFLDELAELISSAALEPWIVCYCVAT